MPHSILKKSKTLHATAPPPPATSSREDRNKETALYHARLLQQRKDTEALVLASTEALLDVPSSPNADPAHPHHSDAVLVKNLLRPFQPSDYDTLIEERNINEQCGYVLCPQHNRKQDTKARYRILHGKGKNSDALRFVHTQSLEKWCSDECGKRALYIKVQLNEEPAWTRADSSSGDIDLLEDRNSSGSDTILIQEMTNLDVRPAEDRIIESMKALAIERGEGAILSRPKGLRDVDVREQFNTHSRISFPELPVDRSGVPRDSIEGYKPTFSEMAMEGVGTDEEEDILPTI